MRTCWLGALCPARWRRLLSRFAPTGFAAVPDSGANRSENLQPVPVVVERPCVWGESGNRQLDYGRFAAAVADVSDDETGVKFPELGEDDIQVPKEEQPRVECGNCACGIPLGEQLRCGRCTKAMYCSRDCQKEDWKFHRRVCNPVGPEERAKQRVDSQISQIARKAAEKEFRRTKLEEYQRTVAMAKGL
mmetsp:Transcript_23290/g.43785  ORF Transcript_23290/g.43785 Transcript_23290/m.43785 type:complete len:190 (-) Transcript_23290:146-715(-)